MRLCDLAYGCICGPMLRLHAFISAIPAYGLVCGIGVDGPPIRDWCRWASHTWLDNQESSLLHTSLQIGCSLLNN